MIRIIRQHTGDRVLEITWFGSRYEWLITRYGLIRI